MNIALFDFDGTITHTDTFTKFIFFATNKRRLNLGRFVLLPTIMRYKLGLLHGSNIRKKIYKFAFKGITENRIKSQGEEFADSIIPTYINNAAFERIKWHKQNGDLVVIVSASLDVYLKPWCLEHGLDLICTEIESIDGLLTGKYVGNDCSSLEKKVRIEEKYDLSEFSIIYAYGDTPEDNEMLSLADKSFFKYF